MKIIDAHCHLDFEAFDTDRSAVMSRASEAGIEKIVVPGVSAENWPRIHALCSQDSRLHACYGLHPYLTEKHSDQDIDTLSNWLDSHESVAIGECGLDYRKGEPPKQKQLHFFDAQLRRTGSIRVSFTYRVCHNTVIPTFIIVGNLCIQHGKGLGLRTRIVCAVT